MLWYGLEQHIPSSLNETDIDAEFKQFYQGLLTLTLKTKLHSRSKKYTRIKVRYKYKLTDKNQNIVIIKRDKGRGAVNMDKSKCHEKCLMILENGNFKMVDYNSTKRK